MARLDATRIQAWRGMQALGGQIERAIDEELRDDWDISLGWFDVLASLQRLGGRARPLDVAADLRLPPSSVSRRLDRLEEEGWIARHRDIDPNDKRAVEIELTPRGRKLWREMNVTYRRAVQQWFAVHLGDDEIAAVQRVLDLLMASVDELEDDDPTQQQVEVIVRKR